MWLHPQATGELTVRVLKIAMAFILFVLLAGAAISYSWTYTPLGRLEYAAAVLSKLSELDTEPISLSKENREQANAMVKRLIGTAAPLAKIEDREIVSQGNKIPIRIYWPKTPDKENPLPVYLDIHGGGWWMGDGFALEAPTTELARDADIIIVSVDYRLAPEHPYPAPLDDCYAALEWLYANAEDLGGDPNRLGIGGGSAGGNLAAALALRARDEGGPDIDFQFLMIPATDLVSDDWDSYRQTGDRYNLKVSAIYKMFAAYVPDANDRRSPYVSPLLAEDLSGLPPALVVTAHFDPLRDQGIAYAKRLEQAGVPTQLHAEPGGLHGFMGSPERSRRVRELSAKVIRKALHR